MDEIAPALTPAYPFGAPGERIDLYEGPMEIDGRSTSGHVQLRLAPQLDVVWAVEPDWHDRGVGQVQLSVEHPLGTVGTAARRRRPAEGSLAHVDIGRSDAPLQRVVASWLNLPSIGTGAVIDDGGHTFLGRWAGELDGWTVTLDQRSDYADVWSRVKEDGSTEVTHVMEIRRTDGAAFTPVELDPVLDALHLGVSFAVGRWVAPILPVGFDAAGQRVWEQWGARHCTPGAPGGLRWWYEKRGWELEELLRLLVVGFADPSRRFTIRFLLTSAILSAASGFVEQRIMTATAALDHLIWVALRDEYNNISPASRRLAEASSAALIPDGLDPATTPALHRFAESRQLIDRSAPSALYAVRNKIVHPTRHENTVYHQFPGLLTETWLLAQHYLVLLILHHLGYPGSYQPQLKPGGCAGDVEPVPWAG